MKYFKLPELIDRNTFMRHGEDAWKLLDSNALDALDSVREFFNAPITVNSWWEGRGSFQYRGYRPQDCPVGSQNSYHKRGMAFDFDVKGYTAEDARKVILENQDNPLLEKIQRMEDKVSWVHIDIGAVPKDKQRIYLFRG